MHVFNTIYNHRQSVLAARSVGHDTAAAGQHSAPPHTSAPTGSTSAKWQERSITLKPKLPAPERMPQHIAVIMDGNARWAQRQGLPVAIGHQRGVEALRMLVQCCCEWSIPCLTVYALSKENIRRPPQEVRYLLSLFESVLQNEIDDLIDAGVSLDFIGDVVQLPVSLQEAISKAKAATAASNSRLQLNVAINYGARQDLVYAVQQLAQRVESHELEPNDITAEMISAELSTRQISQFPDIIIRTAGEQRLSNFLLWEAAYSELYFSDLLWPDFCPEELVVALTDYSHRQRRFGVR